MPKKTEDLSACFCLPKDCTDDLLACFYLPKDFMEDLTTVYQQVT